MLLYDFFFSPGKYILLLQHNLKQKPSHKVKETVLFLQEKDVTVNVILGSDLHMVLGCSTIMKSVLCTSMFDSLSPVF